MPTPRAQMIPVSVCDYRPVDRLPRIYEKIAGRAIQSTRGGSYQVGGAHALVIVPAERQFSFGRRRLLALGGVLHSDGVS
jgi:hypothetical protein